jgi:aminopeptidase N
MLRMMLYDFARNDDARFVQLMHDYTKEYANQSASTEDFKRVVERHFGQDMSWFFNQWVYGTEIPSITVEYTLADQEKGVVLKGTIRQSGVSPEYRSLVPFLLRFPNNGAVSGKLQARGATTNFSIALPVRPEGVEFNPLDAILCDLEVKKL